MKFIKKILPLLIIIAGSFFAFAPLLQNGFFPMHDDTQVVRVYEMAKSLKMGMFPVRWVPDLGYGLGYPIFNFYAPLSYYFGSVFNILGFDALVSTKITMITGILLAAVSMYLLVKELFGKTAGVVSAFFYVYAPYHALDIYVRGDVAEFWAYAFVPLTFYGILKIYKERRLIFTFVAALAFAGLILSHNLTAFMVTPFLLLTALFMSTVLYKLKKYKTIMYLLGSLFMGLGLSCFYWLPALTQMNNTNVMSVIGGGSYFADHFACVSQLWTSPWGYGGSARGCIDGLSLMIGKLHILASLAVGIIAIIFLILKKYKKPLEKFLIIFYVLFGFFFSSFLVIEPSKIIWQTLPLMEFFQFPWRFILLSSFFSSILAGSLIFLLSQLPLKKVFPYFAVTAGAILIFILLILNTKFFMPQEVFNVDSNYYTNERSLKWKTSKISDEYLPKNTKKPKNEELALLNKQKFSFRETPIEKFSNAVSLTGILLLFIGIIKFRKTHE